MALFVIERNFAEQLDVEALDQAGIKAVNDEVGVRWVYSFLSADKKKTYCLYEAPNPEAIREAAARLGIPADVIVSVDQIGPSPATEQSLHQRNRRSDVHHDRPCAPAGRQLRVPRRCGPGHRPRAGAGPSRGRGCRRHDGRSAGGRRYGRDVPALRARRRGRAGAAPDGDVRGAGGAGGRRSERRMARRQLDGRRPRRRLPRCRPGHRDPRRLGLPVRVVVGHRRPGGTRRGRVPVDGSVGVRDGCRPCPVVRADRDRAGPGRRRIAAGCARRAGFRRPPRRSGGPSDVPGRERHAGHRQQCRQRRRPLRAGRLRVPVDGSAARGAARVPPPVLPLRGRLFRGDGGRDPPGHAGRFGRADESEVVVHHGRLPLRPAPGEGDHRQR